MAQIEPEDLQAMSPFGEVWFLRVALGRIPGETGGDDEMGPATQELEPGLIADLHPATGEQCDAAAQVSQFGALAEVQLGAGGAHLVIKMVNQRVLLLANVTMLRLDGLAGGGLILMSIVRHERFGRVDVRRGEDGLAAQRTDASFVANCFHALIQ